MVFFCPRCSNPSTSNHFRTAQDLVHITVLRKSNPPVAPAARPPREAPVIFSVGVGNMLERQRPVETNGAFWEVSPVEQMVMLCLSFFEWWFCCRSFFRCWLLVRMVGLCFDPGDSWAQRGVHGTFAVATHGREEPWDVQREQRTRVRPKLVVEFVTKQPNNEL